MLWLGWPAPTFEFVEQGPLKKKENLKLVDAIMGQPKAHCFLKDRSEFSEYTKDKKKKLPLSNSRSVVVLYSRSH